MILYEQSLVTKKRGKTHRACLKKKRNSAFGSDAFSTLLFYYPIPHFLVIGSLL